MTISFNSRRDYKDAGRAMAIEGTEALVAHLLTVASQAPQDLTEAYVEEQSAKLIGMLDAVVEGHLSAGAPAMWVMRFRTAFLRTLGEKMRDVSLALKVGGWRAQHQGSPCHP